MATKIQRPRIRPTWRSGLRRGKIRNSTMVYLRNHPEEFERLLRIIEEVRAQGFEPISMEGVRQPFDFAPRTVSSITRRIH
ncbi:MAG TPA: hypothetical protein VFR37_06160 [Longimicrobium sp.]|nr:hypothetical protein [Longimicrobium sp.]